ncbi:MAG: pilus assembly FimT family protein [Thiobacillus sp.]
MRASSFIKNRRTCGGFTMVELILVMVIAGILAAVAVPRLVGKNSFDTRGYVDQLAATVRFAQKLAISQRRDVFVQLTATDATLCYDAGCASLAPGPGGEKPYAVTAPNGVAIASPLAVLGFDAGGRPNIAAQLDIPVNGAGAYHVLVEQETGYVHD